MDNVTISREKLRAQLLHQLKTCPSASDAHLMHAYFQHIGVQATGIGGEIGALYSAMSSAADAAWQDYVAEVAH